MIGRFLLFVLVMGFAVTYPALSCWALSPGGNGPGGGPGDGGDGDGHDDGDFIGEWYVIGEYVLGREACPFGEIWMPGVDGRYFQKWDEKTRSMVGLVPMPDPDVDEASRYVVKDPAAWITPREDEVEKILAAHEAWILDKEASESERGVLCNAYLEGYDLSYRDLQRADLRGAWLAGVDLSGSDLTGADLRYARGLAALKWTTPPKGIGIVREGFIRAGLRQNERELTYSIMVNRIAQAPTPERVFNTVLFDWTSGYGRYPGRPLIIVAIVFVALIPLYFAAVALPSSSSTGIYKFWPPGSERINDHNAEKPPEILRLSGRGFLAAIGWATWFSLLSAFHIGWRDLNVGSWLGRIQSAEFTLRPLGWPRVVSGFQSLLSVYLIALAALTYFGRPFH